MPFELVSPLDHEPLVRHRDHLVTPDGTQRFPIVNEVPQLIQPDRLTRVEQFASTYRAVRRAEGRQSDDCEYYRALPYKDLSGNFINQWARRARTFDALCAELGDDPLDVVDAGAGNCWLSARLTALGHSAIAIDVNDNEDDGLLASRHYEQQFAIARAEMTSIPLGDGSADVVIFNAAAHYVALADGLAEASRVLRPGGRVVIADSPLYRSERAGRAMIVEMADHISAMGVAPAEYAGQGFLTEVELDASPVGWRRVDLDGGRLRSVKRRLAAARAGRELATLPLLIATVDDHARSEVA